ncbi:MAG: glycoside hydrolase family 20 protein [Phocaeicola sp.]
MNNFKKCLFFLTATLALGACAERGQIEGDFNVIPLPQEITLQSGAPYLLSPASVIVYTEGNEKIQQIASFLNSYIQTSVGYELKIATAQGSNSAIRLTLDSSITNPEGYRLSVNEKGIEIVGSTEAGLFYGVQTLRKSLPVTTQSMDVALAAVEINDEPRFGYRGMMIDVSRHFLNVEEMKTYIEILALHNLNRLHWHLTDDQGWRIEIKKYPKLTEVGAKRTETVIGRNSGEFDGKPYDGFYTQEDIREILAYADQHFITVIPEIDLPGHQQAALAAYPELGCTGGPYEVWREWGISDDVICAGNEQALLFLEDVLDEVTQLFPSKYIHIGGDECPKVRWKVCPKCQARIKSLGIKGDKQHSAEEYLQSYVISRMETFLAGKGRQIIGWDEILEGGLAPNATVMSWRGIQGGIEAAKQGHDVIMTPNSYLYFDHYQTTQTDNEPLAIGGYNSLEKVYSYDAIPQELTSSEQKHILGVQANLWAEYLPNVAQNQYMTMPRIAALAEIQWTQPAKKEYSNFLQRIPKLIALYDKLGYNYAKHLFDVHAEFSPNTEKKEVLITLSTLGKGTIHYTLDGSEPTATSAIYESPLPINESVQFRAVVIQPNGTHSRTLSEDISFGKATAKSITLVQEPSRGYSFNGAAVLIDGLSGGSNYKTGRWLGFQGRDVDATIDLKELVEVSHVSFNTNVVPADWIMGARGVTVWVSEDSQSFKQVANQEIPSLKSTDKEGLYPHQVIFDQVNARYIRVLIKGDKLPSWHSGAGNPAYIFVDEINVN